MTFYSIIYGMLFLGSTSALFTLLIEGKYEEFLLAVILCLLIYCDTIYTSDYFEREDHHVNYRRGMQFIDLVSFLIISLLIILICPESTFILNIDETKMSEFFKRVFENKIIFYYTLLLIYCSLAIRWNEIAQGQGYYYLLSRIFSSAPVEGPTSFLQKVTSFINRAYYYLLSAFFIMALVTVLLGYYHYLMNLAPITLIIFSILFDLVTPEST